MPTDAEVKAYMMETIRGRSNVDWLDYSIEIENDFCKVGMPLESRQFERCYWELVKEKKLRHHRHLHGWQDFWGVSEVLPKLSVPVPQNQLSLFEAEQ